MFLPIKFDQVPAPMATETDLKILMKKYRLIPYITLNVAETFEKNYDQSSFYLLTQEFANMAKGSKTESNIAITFLTVNMIIIRNCIRYIHNKGIHSDMLNKFLHINVGCARYVKYLVKDKKLCYMGAAISKDDFIRTIDLIIATYLTLIYFVV